jgi:CyaY protein
MDDADFDRRIEATLESLEWLLDEVDVDYENSAGILTVEFENDTSMIFSRQSGNNQLWLAARSGGYHFRWDEQAGDWRCTRSEELLKPLTNREMLAQGQIELNWS